MAGASLELLRGIESESVRFWGRVLGMAGRVSPLLVRLSPGGPSLPERLETKLELHFQSPKRSGGGECTVRAQEPERGLYAVSFLSQEAKERVKAHKEHFIKVDGRTLEISILPNSEFAQLSPGERSLTNNKSLVVNSLPASSTMSLQNDFERKLDGRDAGDDDITKKIFLSVSATLNTDLLTIEERSRVTMVCPNLKVDVCSRQLGIEKVSGDYGDIQKLHSHFEKLLGNSHQHRSTFSQPKGKNRLKEMDVDMENLKEESKDNFEGMSNMEVPSALFEYFSQACKEEVEELEQKFNVRLTWKDHGKGLTSVGFASLGARSSIERAQQKFVTTFQRIASDVKQERIPFRDDLHLKRAQELLSTRYKSILVKTDGNALILRGPAREISAAKSFIEEIKAKDLDKNPKAHSPMSGLEVDADTFEFLMPILAKDIQTINEKYDTEMDIKPSLKSEKLYIFFKPNKSTYLDECPKAYNSFFQIYQTRLSEYREKTISFKLSEAQKKLLDVFFTQLQTENPRIVMQKNEDQLVICGCAEEICKTEKYIKKFLESAVKPSPKSVGISIPASSTGATSSAPFEQNTDLKNKLHLSQEKSDLKAMGVEQEEKCSICMDKIHQKEVLPKCKHEFCRDCIKEAMKHKPACPVCNEFYGKIKGNQPPGRMDILKSPRSLPGYEGSGTITITYTIPDGIQTVSLSSSFMVFHHNQ
ncbi:hypothetical protein JD844_022488 [Phrynosoma platyrhinos]|uniref:E3 ubiquitin-protein ligase n=1 Tax=Phrynosoma platyrhinos TaxID=52577 RepID=A0ABQ7SVH5_PHRPL|nr:hypothetical protein JD844_022488 [Phrynosoma platyrhinos]